MRRKDRQVTDPAELRQIIASCECLHLGLCCGDMPYVVPVNFGFEETEKGYVFYFHGATEGKKLDMLRANPHVALCMDTGHELMTGDGAEEYSYRYASVMGEAVAEILQDREEKRHGLACVFNHYSDKEFSVSEKMLDATAVVKLTAENLIGKRH